MFEALRVKTENGDQLEFVRRGDQVHVLLTHGDVHLRYRVPIESLLNTLAVSSDWNDWPHGRCPSCARADGKLESAFCSTHRKDYIESAVGKLQERDETS